jgi:hypothetical protein
MPDLTPSGTAGKRSTELDPANALEAAEAELETWRSLGEILDSLVKQTVILRHREGRLTEGEMRFIIATLRLRGA